MYLFLLKKSDKKIPPQLPFSWHYQNLLTYLSINQYPHRIHKSIRN